MAKVVKRTIPEITDAEEARIQAAIARDPDHPELSEDQFARMRPASDVLPPVLYAALTRARGRPKSPDSKVAIKLRLDRVAVEAFRATGTGWQTRMNDTLVAAAKKLRGR